MSKLPLTLEKAGFLLFLETSSPWQCGPLPRGILLASHGSTGERYDSDLGLSYLRARWYNQGTGRFLTMDTYPINLQDPVELNRYGYTANNPVNLVDPSGLVMAEQGIKQCTIDQPTKVAVEALGLAVACTLLIHVDIFFSHLAGSQIIGINWIACATKKKSTKWQCQAQCNVTNFSNVPNAPARVFGSGEGNTQTAACEAAKTAAVHQAPRGTYARHCKCFDCTKR